MKSSPHTSHRLRKRIIREWRSLSLAAVLIGCAVIAAILIVPRMMPTSLRHETDVGSFDIQSFLNARRILEYEQPSPELLQVISQVYDAEQTEAVPESSVSSDLVLRAGLPFFPYWQGEDTDYIFHPMAMGGFLARLGCDEDIVMYLDAVATAAHVLPNSGFLWYYPDNYRLNRFIGPDLSPSAISQGTILSAITTLDRRCEADLSELARHIFLGLSYDYYLGGVSLEEKALLEIPLFRSPPEIILNGWLHALLGLGNYAHYYRDAEAAELLAANVRYLSEILPRFHNADTGLSLYSDLSPYRLRVSHEQDAQPRLTAFYVAKGHALDDLVFPLNIIDHESQSPYDNQIIRHSRTFTDVWISCSQNYETYLVSDVPITVSLSTGVYSPQRSTPGTGGEQLKFESTVVGAYHVIHITSERDRLFCGYPTNFSKLGGENYYHSQHVVALACLLVTLDLPVEVRAIIQTWMNTWMETVESTNEASGLHFSTFEKVLEKLVKHGIFTLTDDWHTLLRIANGLTL